MTLCTLITNILKNLKTFSPKLPKHWSTCLSRVIELRDGNSFTAIIHISVLMDFVIFDS
jgi:hypothetical protein